MKRRKSQGFTILELAVATSVFGFLVCLSAWTVKNTIKTATNTMSATAFSVHTRRVSDDIEAILTSSGASTLEGITTPSWLTGGMLALARSALDQSMGDANVRDMALPLADQSPSNIFFQFPEPTNPKSYKPRDGYCSMYLRPQQREELFELVYFNGSDKRILCKNLADAAFAYKDGKLDVLLDHVVDPDQDDFDTLTTNHTIVVRVD